MNTPKATIITIGDELLMGQVVDTNGAWIARALNEIGIQVHRKTSVGDNEESILSILEAAVIATDVVIITGGLGPTADDITKPALCKFFACKLRTDERVLHHVEEIFARRNKPLLERNMRQADVPDCCTVLFNAIGTAPGMWFEKKNKYIVSLPGVPSEMMHLMKQSVVPELAKKLSGAVIRHKHLVTAGEGESAIAELLVDFEQNLPQHVSLAYLPNHSVVRLRLTGMGSNSATLESTLERLQQELATILGKWVIACEDVSVEAVLGNILVDKKYTVATAESCTGGNVAHRITDVPGSSRYFVGSIVAYANEEKQRQLGVAKDLFDKVGAVSQEVVEAMAKGGAEKFCANLTISLSGILGPDGGTPDKPVGLVWVGLCLNGKLFSKALHLAGERTRIKESATQRALVFALDTLKRYG